MNIVPLESIPMYSRLGQNIYRHDGLLGLPRGIVLRDAELKEIRYHGIDFILTYDKRTPVGNEQDISFTLNIVEEAFTKTTLWEDEFGKKIYDYMHAKIIKNKKVQKYLNELRMADTYSFSHCINISMVVIGLLKTEQVDKETLGKIAYIALLHDVGRLKLLDLFNKQGKLTDAEFERIKSHPEESFKLLKKAGFLDEDIAFVTETHEKYNGTGYPLQLKGDAISDLGQLILISDVYNALSSFRPYRDVYNPHEVLQIIESEAEVTFNMSVVDFFKRNFSPYREGMLVELSNGKLARVKTTHYNKTLPVVNVVSEVTGVNVKVIDLQGKRDLRIKRIIEE